MPWLRAPLARLALVAVPYWAFETEIEAATFRERYRVAIDAVTATLDPYRLAEKIHPDEVAVANRLLPGISEEQARERLMDLARREVYRKGFGRIRDLTIHVTRAVDGDLHVPYWLGFFGDKELALRVLNAHTGAREGRKAVELFEKWLLAP